MESPNPDNIPLERRPLDEPVPLTAVPLRLWNSVLEHGMKRSEMRMCATAARIRGPLDGGILRNSLESLIQRHETLRTRIVSVDGLPRQQVDAPRACDLETIDLSALPSAEAEAKRLAQAFIEEQIDLACGPAFEPKLLRLAPDEHVLILAVDHMFSDAASWGILGREVWALYNQAARGQPSVLPPLEVQFADYAVWQERIRDAWRARHARYWKDRLEGAPRAEIPLDPGRQPLANPRSAVVYAPFGQELSSKLRDFAQRERVLLPLVVLTIHLAAMAKWCAQPDLVFTFMSHGRHRRPALANMVGFLANRQYLRVTISAGDSFLDVLRQVQAELAAAQEHHDFDWVPDLFPGCRTELEFNWLPGTWTKERSPKRKVEAASPLQIQPFPLPPFPPRRTSEAFRLAPMFSDTSAGIIATLLYRPDLLSAQTISRFGHELRRLAEIFVEHPRTTVATVDSGGQP